MAVTGRRRGGDYTLGGTTEDDRGRRTIEDDGGRRTMEDGGRQRTTDDRKRRMTEDDGRQHPNYTGCNTGDSGTRGRREWCCWLSAQDVA